jgi:enamine deaminase RidA (YjgF/YER057c/UK114 family)
MPHRLVNPNDLPPPKGFTHGVISEAGGKTLAISGQVGWDGTGRFAGDDVAAQFKQCLKNILSVLRASGATPENILRMTIYITDRDQYLKQIDAIGTAYKAFVGRHLPAMTLIVVKDLLEPGAKVAMDALAWLPEKGGAGEFTRHGQGVAMPDTGLRGAKPPVRG